MRNNNTNYTLVTIFCSHTQFISNLTYSPHPKFFHLACQVIPRIHSKLAAVILVVSDARLHRSRILAVALEPAVDGSYRGSESLPGDD